MFFKLFPYLSRYSDIAPSLAKAVPQMCMQIKDMDRIYINFRHILKDFSQ